MNVSPNKRIRESYEDDGSSLAKRRCISHDTASMDVPANSYSNPDLTPSQIETTQDIITFIQYYKVLVVRGESQIGKDTCVKAAAHHLNANVVKFSVCSLARETERALSSQDLVSYLISLINEASEQQQKTDRTSIIYIPKFNRLYDIFSDSNSPLRFLTSLIFNEFCDMAPDNVRILFTTDTYFNVYRNYWLIDMNNQEEDMRFIFNKYQYLCNITDEEIEQMIKVNKKVVPGKLIFCLKHVQAMRGNKDHNKPAKHYYLKSLSKFYPTALDVKKDVPKVNIEQDLIGMDDILAEIDTSIIKPIELGNDDIPVKRGLLLCGPPGTGKTSIGKYLARKLSGKFYLLGSALNAGNLVDSFDDLVNRAKQNTPAVVFVDDGDMLFRSPDIYRAFLTILDGIETNKRKNVCIILTCMDPKKVPSSLVRGGRLEMCLVTRLPTQKNIMKILEVSVTKMMDVLPDEITSKIFISNDDIRKLSHDMTGWNCADIRRCVEDVSRMLLSNRPGSLEKLFKHCIKSIRDQYTYCGKCDTIDLDNNMHSLYIN